VKGQGGLSREERKGFSDGDKLSAVRGPEEAEGTGGRRPSRHACDWIRKEGEVLSQNS